MIYVLPFNLYEDWKELMYAIEVAKYIVKELKEKQKGDASDGRVLHGRYYLVQ